MKTYGQWAADNFVTHHDDAAMRDWLMEEIVAGHKMHVDQTDIMSGDISELKEDRDKAFGLEDRRHRHVVAASEKSRRRINQLEREAQQLRSFIGNIQDRYTVGDGGEFYGPDIIERLAGHAEAIDAVSAALATLTGVFGMMEDQMLEMEQRTLANRIKRAWRYLQGYK